MFDLRKKNPQIWGLIFWQFLGLITVFFIFFKIKSIFSCLMHENVQIISVWPKQSVYNDMKTGDLLWKTNTVKWIAKLIRHTLIIFILSFVHFANLCLIGNFLWMFLIFEIRENLDLRKILGVTNIFLKSRFVCNLKQIIAG